MKQSRTRSISFGLALLLAVPLVLFGQGQRGDAPPAGGRGGGGGQGRGGGGQGAPQTAKATAPVDLTGYWVSIVTEDWIERMSPDSPPSGTGGRGGLRGQAPAVPPAGADPCRAYGAAGSLRVPGRVNITWADDNTLKIDMDAGKQTRLLHFGANAPKPGGKTLQGHSVATWEVSGGARGGALGAGGASPAVPRWGNLKVVTTNMTGGYLLSTRSSYSENATLTEHFTRHTDFGVDYFTVTAIIEDPGANPPLRMTSSTFKKEPNGSKFSPTGCEIVR